MFFEPFHPLLDRIREPFIKSREKIKKIREKNNNNNNNL